MPDINSLQFELERRGIIFHRDTTLPDGSLLGYTGDPNNCVNGATQGQTLLFNCPSGTKYLNKGVSPYVVWEKVEDTADGRWINISAGSTNSALEVESFVLTETDITNEYVLLSYTPIEPEVVVVMIQNGPGQHYGIDYVQDSLFLKRTKWEDLGLSTVLAIGDRLTILYKREL